ncbi:MAG: arginase family protein [Chloroflexota bacterium]|nr:arginase family protein [Chloroflexota bacterium]
MTTERTVSPGFLGLPVTGRLDEVSAGTVAVIGVPHGVRYPRQAHDSSGAPAAIRERSQRFAPFIGHHDFDLNGPLAGERTTAAIVDCGDVPDGPSATTAIAALLDRGAIPVVLGGDDSVPIPVLRAYDGHGPLTVVQVDAHLDFRDEVDGVRDGYSSPMRRASEMAWVERIVHVGLRGVGSATSGDVADARAAGNVLITAREVRRLGIETVFDRLPDDRRWFVALDCDGLDPSVMPAVNAPLPGGLSFDEVADLLRGLAERGTIVGMSVTELVPERDVNGLSAVAATRLVWLLAGAISASVSGSSAPIIDR